ncbi:hypothetical protein P7C70_g1960, partial [Phenoliferia sp. Uapishka_3]
MPLDVKPRPLEDSTAAVWDGLLAWLRTMESSTGGKPAVKNIRIVDTKAGRGLFADSKIAPNTPLIAIPTKALLNTTTIRPYYPDHFLRTLTATQHISLHLALQSSRHATGTPTISIPRDFFQPFLRSIPTDFPTVPLMWSIRSRTNEELRKQFEVSKSDTSLDTEETTLASRLRFRKLLDLMPSSVSVRALDVEKRFKADWLQVRDVWGTHCNDNLEEEDTLRFGDYLLGWLNVNTRCVFWDMGGKTSNSLTLAPIIDMINHRVGQLTKPLQTAISLEFSSPAYGSPDPQLVNGAELGFSYGAHEDPMLLTEYGFSLGNSENPYNNVSIDEEITEMFDALGNEGVVKKEVLQDAGYWGAWTLQAAPPPASASWRVFVALRLYHLSLPRRTTSSSTAALEPFFDMVDGTTDIVDEANEKRVKKDVARMSKSIEYERSQGVKKCEGLEKEWKPVEGIKLEKECLGMLKGIWEGERVIAEAVLKEGK